MIQLPPPPHVCGRDGRTRTPAVRTTPQPPPHHHQHWGSINHATEVSLLLSRLASSLKISLSPFFIRENKGKVKPQIRASKRIIFGYGEMILTQKQSKVGKNHGLNCEKDHIVSSLTLPFRFSFPIMLEFYLKSIFGHSSGD